MSKKKPMKTKEKVYTGRDLLQIEIIKGVTKAGVQKDQRKEQNKNKCRNKKWDKDE